MRFKAISDTSMPRSADIVALFIEENLAEILAENPVVLDRLLDLAYGEGVLPRCRNIEFSDGDVSVELFAGDSVGVVIATSYSTVELSLAGGGYKRRVL